MKIRREENGFSSVALYCIIVLAAALGWGGWYTWHVMHRPHTAITTASKAKTAESVETDGLKRYVNQLYGFSFTYPTTWKLTVKLDDYSLGRPQGDVFVTSPYGTKVHFGPNLGGQNSNCIEPHSGTYTAENCYTRNILSIDKLPSSSDNKPVYFYKIALTAPLRDGGKTIYYIDIMGGGPAPLKTGSTIGAFLYPYDEINNTTIGALTVYVEGPDDVHNHTASFYDSQEIAEATPILQSFLLLHPD